MNRNGWRSTEKHVATTRRKFPSDTAHCYRQCILIYIKRFPYILLESHPSGSAGPRKSRPDVKYTPTKLTECGKAIPLQHCKQNIDVHWSRFLQCDAAQARIETLIVRSCPETTMDCRNEKMRRRVHDKVYTRNELCSAIRAMNIRQSNSVAVCRCST